MVPCTSMALTLAFAAAAAAAVGTDSLTGTWVAEGVGVRMIQTGERVTSSAPWGTGVGTLVPGPTLHIVFSNSAHRYVGVVFDSFSCIRWDNGHVWARSGFACPGPPSPPPPVPPPPAPPVAVAAPAWTAHASVYEIAPKAFTSPAGPGSGTLRSAAAMLPLLADVGVNCVWLAGWAWSNSHFRGIWSTYAAVDLGTIDPSLGGPDALREFVQRAHGVGVKVVLDVTTHGVVPSSPLIAEHRSFFLDNGTSGTWRMIDYNYSDAAFRSYWPPLFNRLVSVFGVDGFRLDCGLGGGRPGGTALARPLWDEVVLAANASGHPIVVVPENGETYHFTQHDTAPTTDMAAAVAALMRNGSDATRLCRATVQISCHDFGKTTNKSGNYFALHGSRAVLGYNLLGPMIAVMMSGEEFNADQIELPNVSLGHYGMNTSCNAADPPGTDPCYGPSYWLYGARLRWSRLRADQLAMRNDTKAIFAIRAAHSDVLHSDLCSTRIRVVNASAVGANGRQRRYLAARAASAGAPITVAAAAGAAAEYAPYARFVLGEKAVVVAANPGADATLRLRLAIGSADLRAMGLDKSPCVSVQDMYRGGPARAVSVRELGALDVTIAPDKSPRGGLSVLLLLPSRCPPSLPAASRH